MANFVIKKGLDLPVLGAPDQRVDALFNSSKLVSRVGLICADFPFLKPILEVKVGDEVKIGDPLFIDNKSQIKFTSIAGGKIRAVNRGARRKLISIEIDLSENEEMRTFPSYTSGEILNLSSKAIREQLVVSGAWTSFRTRPFSKVPDPQKNPRSIFITAVDSNPLAPRPEVIIEKNQDSFKTGLDVIARMSPTPVHVCVSPVVSYDERFKIPHGESSNIFFHFFSGKHPAGLVGTHIHHLDPITGPNDEVWHIGYQDVIAIGKLFREGRIFLDRYVALSGPQMSNPRIVKTRKGADLLALVQGEVEGERNRVVSGSLLNGHNASESGWGFLGNFDNSVSVLREDNRRFFHGFVWPGFNDFSVKPIVASRLLGKKLFSFGTLLNGSVRDVVPIGSYEAVMPLDIEITFLVRALLAGDTDTAEKLGALELDEEDLALVTFACPGKNDIGKALGEILQQIEKELS